MNTVRWLALSLLVTANLALAEDRFVAPTGNDANDGRSTQTAFRTLAAAGRVTATGNILCHLK